MNGTQKALWFSGIFSAVLTAVIVSVVNDARHKLERTVIDVAKHEVRINHNAENINDVEVRFLEFMAITSGTHDSVIRIEEKMKSFERAE